MPSSGFVAAPLINKRLIFFEFISNCIIEAISERADVLSLQRGLFKRAVGLGSIQNEYRFFSILTDHISRTCQIVRPGYILVGLISCFPPVSLFHTPAVRFAIRHAGNRFPYRRMALMLEVQKIQSHRDLELFVEVLNLCKGKVFPSSTIALLNCITDPILGRAAVHVIEHEIEMEFWQNPMTQSALSSWIAELFHGSVRESGEKCEEMMEQLRTIGELNVGPLGEVLKGAADRASVPWPLLQDEDS